MLLSVPLQAELNPPLKAETVEVPVEEMYRIAAIVRQQQAEIIQLRDAAEVWKRAAQKFRCA